MELLVIGDELTEAMVTTLEEIAEEFVSNDMTYDYEPTIEAIEHKSFSGFMPFTNGGHRVMLPTTLYDVYGSGRYPAHEKTREYIDGVIERSLKDAVKEFCERNTEKLSKFFTLAEIEKGNQDVINYHDLYEKGAGSLAEQLSEFEYEWLSEGSTFWYQMQIVFYAADNYRNISGEDEVLFMAGTNTDFEYGRDNGLDLSFELCVPVKDLTPEFIKATVTKMGESI